MMIECSYCKKHFNRKPSLLRKNKNFYCNKLCRYKNTAIKRACLTCGNHFVAIKSLFLRTGAKYCSKQCAGNGQPKGILSKNWKQVSRICLICRKKFIAKLGRVKNGWAEYCSRKCRSVAFSGSGSATWQGGITKLNAQIRHHPKYLEWRKYIFSRDRFKCLWCGDNRGHNLNADHIRPFSILMKDGNIKTIEDAINYIPLWDISNGRTLCEKCHRTTESYLSGKGRSCQLEIPMYI